MKYNRKVALFVSFIAMIGSFYYTYVIFYLRKCASMDIQKWDSKTVTASDFTIQIPITNEIWMSYQHDKTYKMHNPRYGCNHGSLESFNSFLRYEL